MVELTLASFPGPTAGLFFAHSKITAYFILCTKKSWAVESGNEARVNRQHSALCSATFGRLLRVIIVRHADVLGWVTNQIVALFSAHEIINGNDVSVAQVEICVRL